MTVNTFFDILSWVITGGIAGYVASILLRTERQGCFLNIALGIVGAFVGGFLMGNFLAEGGVTRIGWVNAVINATVGAIVVLVVLEIALPGKQLGVRGGGSKKKRRR